MHVGCHVSVRLYFTTVADPTPEMWKMVSFPTHSEAEEAAHSLCRIALRSHQEIIVMFMSPYTDRVYEYMVTMGTLPQPWYSHYSCEPTPIESAKASGWLLDLLMKPEDVLGNYDVPNLVGPLGDSNG